jgi:hypothetical protein
MIIHIDPNTQAHGLPGTDIEVMDHLPKNVTHSVANALAFRPAAGTTLIPLFEQGLPNWAGHVQAKGNHNTPAPGTTTDSHIYTQQHRPSAG